MWMVHPSSGGVILFAQVGRLEWDLVVPVGALIGVVALGIWAIVKIKRWREQTVFDDALTPEQILLHYQSMVEDGSLEPDEFARIKAQMEAQTRPTPTHSDVGQLPAPQPPDSSVHEE